MESVRPTITVCKDIIQPAGHHGKCPSSGHHIVIRTSYSLQDIMESVRPTITVCKDIIQPSGHHGKCPSSGHHIVIRTLYSLQDII